MDESRKHYAEWKKSDSKGWIVYDSAYTMLQKRQNYGTAKRISWGWGWGEGIDYKGAWGKFGGDLNTLYLHCHRTVYASQNAITCISRKNAFYCIQVNLNKLKTSGRLVFVFLHTHTPPTIHTHTHTHRKQEKTQGKRRGEEKKRIRWKRKGDFLFRFFGKAM